MDKPAPLSGAEFRALRLRLGLYLGLGLFWAETRHGNQPIERAMNRLSDVERPVNQKIVARAARAKG